MTEQLLSSPFFYSLGLSLIHFLWQGLLVALLLKSALFIIPDKNPQLRYAFSAFAMLLCLLLPVITFCLIYQPDNIPLAHFGQLLAEEKPLNAQQQITGYWWSNDLVENLPYVSFAWLSIVIFLAVKLLMQVYSVNHLPKLASRQPDAELAARFALLAERVRLKRLPRLLISLKAEVPMAIGWLKPVVLLPASMITGLSSAQLDMLILHELAHIRRHDYLVNFLQTLVEILLFFHPCVLWIAKKMRIEREYCSDDIAVALCGDHIAYAHTLADTAEICAKHRHSTIPVMAMAASGGDLKQRVVRLVNHHCAANDNDHAKWLAPFTVLLAIFLLTSVLTLPGPLQQLAQGKLPFSQSQSNSFFDAKSSDYLPEHENTSIARELLAIQTPLPGITAQEKEQTNALPSEQTSPQPATVNVATQTPPAPVAAQQNLNREAVQQTPMQTEPATAKTSLSKAREPALAQLHLDEKQEFARQQTQPAAFNKDTVKSSSNSERAFIRTDSSNKFSPVNNPYANQVAALARELSREKPAAEKPRANKVKNSFATDKVNARLINSVEPKYPTTAKRKGLELEVKVRFTIDVDGKVRDLVFAQNGKANYFKRNIRNAMAKWRFTPAQQDGKAVPSQMSKIFSFNLK
ncbi:M56 family metallopeptidase [Thalassomonas actiniarum]|uniref:Protein TonB n=1 Tax=Thalassomonas actiniarum TaxID=485447 RepID=A0AAE9YRR5_9GAMM|nr:M56 family metallopeptidase [Thalassomonas actiniarum]WDD99507.1 TonB family protein [Thalassomonas actiniarum]